MKKYLVYGFLTGLLTLSLIRGTLDSIKDSRYARCDSDLTVAFASANIGLFERYQNCLKNAEFSTLENIIQLKWR